jgi:hypothetical protein
LMDCGECAGTLDAAQDWVDGRRIFRGASRLAQRETGCN